MYILHCREGRRGKDEEEGEEKEGEEERRGGEMRRRGGRRGGEGERGKGEGVCLKKDSIYSSYSPFPGVFAESRRWVRPIRDNKSLKESFISYILPPNSHEKLYKLSECVSQLVTTCLDLNSFFSFSPPPPSPLPPLLPLSLSPSLSPSPSPLSLPLLLPLPPPPLSLSLSHVHPKLQARGSALRMGKEPTPSTDSSLDPVLSSISHAWEPRIKENTSLIVVCEACLGKSVSVHLLACQSDHLLVGLPIYPSLYIIPVFHFFLEFPQHVLKKMIELKPEKRELLMNVVSSHRT